MDDWVFTSEYLEVESTLDTLEDSVQVKVNKLENWRTTSSISLFRDNPPQLIYFADCNGLLLSENVLLFYLLLIPPAPPPVVFQHRTLLSLSIEQLL